MKEFVEKLISRLEEYKYSHLVERNSLLTKHCEEKESFCAGSDCTLCVWDKSISIVNQLAEEYETSHMDGQGTFYRFPCKVGDTLYRIDTDEKIDNAEIEPFTVEYIVIYENGEVLFKYDAYDGVICHLENIITDKPYLDYYRVFLTKEEAEQALAEMKGV